jgi:hypothetical protein
MKPPENVSLGNSHPRSGQRKVTGEFHIWSSSTWQKEAPEIIRGVVQLFVWNT